MCCHEAVTLRTIAVTLREMCCLRVVAKLRARKERVAPTLRHHCGGSSACIVRCSKVTGDVW